MAQRRDLSTVFGHLYGRLTPFEEVKHYNGRRHVRCRCECGHTVVAELANLLSGQSKSCGCWNRDLNLTVHRTHGKCYTPEYKIWLGIKKRCTSPNQRAYRLYGARGIRMCDEWLNDFPAFLRDMGLRPSPLHSIERKNNDGNYTPSNCVWALPIVQANNSRRNHRITFNGQTLTLQQWADLRGIKRMTISTRLKAGWSVEDALTIPAVPGQTYVRRASPSPNPSTNIGPS